MNTTLESIIRPANNKDSPAIISLIDTVLGEWNDRVCLDEAEKDLLNIESHYFDQGGIFVVLETNGEITGTHAVLPIDEMTCSFKRLYLQKYLRGGSSGNNLLQWTIDWAKQEKFQKIEFWSDTRFARAHQFFNRFGFKKNGQIRKMTDSFDPYKEFYFSMELD